MKRKLFVLFSMFALVAIAFTSCQKDNLVIDQKDALAVASVESTPVSDAGVTPAIIDGDNNGGNRTCDEVGAEFEVDFDETTGKFDYDEDTGKWKDEDENEYDAFPYEGIIVNYDPETKTLSFTADVPGYCVGAVIVKGGPSANIYFYPEGTTEDSGLGAPGNAGLSNLTFCLIECEEEECWQEETAYGGDTKATTPGAWWFYFDVSGPATQDIYAGQEKVETAFVNIADGILTIELEPNMRLQDVEEAVKVNGYNVLPTRRPASGGFPYKGTDLQIDLAVYGINEMDFYVIHLDVEVKVECPEEPIE